ncbi:MAG: AAC(3) family N-acetyltransferase [Bacteroidales bacterium]|jgi:aminoglycoside 3-N-acetyltransferase|nr:AAC(3) family N-acetyltransferase [Bacteroidales bacterium]
MAHGKYIPYRNVAGELELRPGDTVLLTSDILKLAMKARKQEKEFSAGQFLMSFSNAIGSEGTLLVPAYNFDLEDGDAFDLLKTIPMTGSLGMAAMNDKEFIRTWHPLHSFLVKGKDASALSSMRNISSFGVDSPFAWMHERNALMVFAGTTPAEAMTFTHFVEEAEQVRYRSYRSLSIRYSDADGNASEKLFRIYAKKAGWTMQMHKLEKLFSNDKLRHYRINGVDFFSIRCRDAYDVVSLDIRMNNAMSIAAFSMKLYFRDILKLWLKRFNLFRTTYGKIRSAKRIY